jgi:hypothetical protein
MLKQPKVEFTTIAWIDGMKLNITQTQTLTSPVFLDRCHRRESEWR